MVKLIINYNTEKEQIIEIAYFPCTIGRSPENDISIDDESMSNFHVRIERKDNYLIITDLNKETKTFFKDEPIKDRKLSHGDVLRLGKVNILFEIDISKFDSIDKQYLPEKVAKREIVFNGEITCQNCGFIIDSYKDFCPKCGYRKGQYLPSDTFIEPLERKVVTGGIGILPLLSFIFSLFGPLLLGLGWILGIFLGIVSLLFIRKRGGFARDRKLAVSGIVIGFLWFIIISIAGTYFFYRSKINTVIARNEKQAMAALKDIALAEKIAKSSYYSDEDSNNIAEYVSLEELGKINIPFIEGDLLKGKSSGYKLEMLLFNEENFICEAIPDKYGYTGKRSFVVEADGFIRGTDLGGASTVDKEKELLILFQGKSVFVDYNKEIARKLLRLAEEAAKGGDYKKSRLIIEEIRTHYPLTDIQKELDSVTASVDPFIIDYLSKELYEKAEKEIASGNLIGAKNIFQEIYDKYPSCKIISSVKEKLDQVTMKIDEELSEQVKIILEQARLDYQNGEYEEALKKYKQIAKMYPDTQYVEKNKALIEKLIAEGEESVAGKLLAQVMEADIEKDFAETKRLTDLLQTGYKETAIYQENEEKIVKIMNNSAAHELLYRSLREKQEGNYRTALDHLQKAIEMNPNLKGDMLEILTELYAEVGNKYVDEKDYLTATSYYKELLKLDPKGTLIDKNKFKKAFYESGRISYEKADYALCKNTLIPLDKHFQNDREFNYLLANACIKSDDYDNAIKYYSICHNLDHSILEYRQRRGLAHIALALNIEEELGAILQIKKAPSRNKETEKESREEKTSSGGENPPEEQPSKEIFNTIEATQEIFFEVAKSIVAVVTKGNELAPYFGLGAENRAEGLLKKEEALTEFLKTCNSISDMARECNKRDLEIFERLKGLRNELRAASKDLEVKDSPVFYFGVDLREIESKIDEKEKLTDEACEVGLESLKKLYALRNQAVAELRKRIESYGRNLFMSDGLSELKGILSGQLTGIRTNMSKCRERIMQSADITIDIGELISELD